MDVGKSVPTLPSLPDWPQLAGPTAYKHSPELELLWPREKKQSWQRVQFLLNNFCICTNRKLGIK